MSCFGGRMQEYDMISLDRFDGKNLQSTVYFLSHLHEDHTAGLAEKIFHKRLKSNKDIFLYCSEVTQVLLAASKKYRHLKPFIKGLSINTPTTIVIPDPLFEEKEKVTVTLLPAFHCPGSVMFLIEGSEGTVLYTGDFRWEHFNIEQMHHLRSGESVKKFKSVYIDTTFCSPENLYIPSRQQCVDAVCQLVQEWISISPKHIVNISLRAQYGHEPLLNTIASRLNKKVHVNEHKVAVYNRIQEFHGNFTSDGINTQLHACDKNCLIEVDGEQVLCGEAHDCDKVLVILPTTMYFTQFANLTLDKIIKKINSNFFRACYSFHSSYTEVKDLISYLKPERVFPNVKPPSDKSLAVTQHRLNKMLKECMEMGAGETVDEQEVKELGTLKTRSQRQTNKRKGRESTSDAESLDFGTPVKTARFSFSSSMEAGESASPTNSASKKTGRGKGRGKGKAETASQPVIGTRRSTRRSAATPPSQETTQKKSKKSERSPTPDLFQTPPSDVNDQHSSYSGSERTDSELSLFSSQKSFGISASDDAGSSWKSGSFLAAITSSSEDDASAGRCCLLDDEEQTDEHFEDCCQFTDTEEEEDSLTSKQLNEPTVPKDDVDGDTESSVIRSNGSKTSSIRKSKRGKKAKVASVEVSRDDVSTGSEQDQKTYEDKEHSGERDTSVNNQVDQSKDLKSEDKNKTKIPSGSQCDSQKSVDCALDKISSNNNTRFQTGDGGDHSGDSNDNKEHLNSLFLGIDVNTVDREIGVPHEINYDANLQSSQTNDDNDVEGEKNEDYALESSEELHFHISLSTPDSVILRDMNENINGDNIVTILSDSGDEDTIRDQDNNCSEDIQAVSNKLVTELNDGTVCEDNGSSSSAILITDSDSNEFSNHCDNKVIEDQKNLVIKSETENSASQGHKLFEKSNVVAEDDVIIVEADSQRSLEGKSQDKDSTAHQQEEGPSQSTITDNYKAGENGQYVDIKGKESNKLEISEGLACSNNEKTVIQDDQNDDVIEVVDLTGDDNTAHSENKESIKPGKKTIKISLLTKTENLKKKKNDTNAKTDKLEKDVLHTGDNDDGNECDNDVDSSQEWLSVKKAKVYGGVSKKIKVSNPNITSMTTEKSVLKVDDCLDIDADISETGQMSKLELEERAEVRRQAVGFMCETDSESDTDESTSPGSPEAGLLYDDYVELSSDSDHESGVGGKGLGKNSKTNKGTRSKSYQSEGSKSRNSDQGWLSSRKHNQSSESPLQETHDKVDIEIETDKEDQITMQADKVRIEKTNNDIIKRFPQSEMCLKSDENELVRHDSLETDSVVEPTNSLKEHTEETSDKVKQDKIDSLENTFSSEKSEVSNESTINSKQSVSNSNDILLIKDISKQIADSDKNIEKQGDIANNLIGTTNLEGASSVISNSAVPATKKIDNFLTNDSVKEPTRKISSSEFLHLGNGNDKVIENMNDNSKENSNAIEINIKEKTEIEEDKITGAFIKNSPKNGKSDCIYGKNVVKEDNVKKDSEEKAKVDSVETAKKHDLVKTESIQSDASCTVEANKLSQVIEQKYNDMHKKTDIVKKDDLTHTRESLRSTNKSSIVSLSISATDNTNYEKDKKSETQKVIGWKKQPPANASKIAFISDIMNCNDQPAPPGTEELPEPHKPFKPEINTITSVISRGRSKVFQQKKTSVSLSEPPPSASLHKPLYSSTAGGVDSSVNSSTSSYFYPSSSQISSTPNFPPPAWGQYPYGPPPPAPFPFAAAPTKPTPSLPYTAPIPVQTVSPTFVTTTAVTMPLYTPQSVTYSFPPPEATETKYATAEQSDTSSSSKHSVSIGSASRTKKSAPWQQKKAEMLSKGPSYIAKKDFKQKRATDRENSRQKMIKEEKIFSHSVGNVQYKHNESEVMDIATIKANITALTGLPVVSNVKTESVVNPLPHAHLT